MRCVLFSRFTPFFFFHFSIVFNFLDSELLLLRKKKKQSHGTRIISVFVTTKNRLRFNRAESLLKSTRTRPGLLIRYNEYAKTLKYDEKIPRFVSLYFVRKRKQRVGSTRYACTRKRKNKSFFFFGLYTNGF